MAVKKGAMNGYSNVVAVSADKSALLEMLRPTCTVSVRANTRLTASVTSHLISKFSGGQSSFLRSRRTSAGLSVILPQPHETIGADLPQVSANRPNHPASLLEWQFRNAVRKGGSWSRKIHSS